MGTGALSSRSHAALANSICRHLCLLNSAKGVDLGAASPGPATADFVIDLQDLCLCLAVFGRRGGAAGRAQLLAMLPRFPLVARSCANVADRKERSSGGCLGQETSSLQQGQAGEPGLEVLPQKKVGQRWRWGLVV